MHTIGKFTGFTSNFVYTREIIQILARSQQIGAS